METKTRFVKHSVVLSACLILMPAMFQPVLAQYYNPPAGYSAPPAYDPYAAGPGYGYPPPTTPGGGYEPYASAGQQPYAQTPYGYPPPTGTTAYGYPPPAGTTPYGYTPASPYTGGEAATFGAAPGADDPGLVPYAGAPATNMMAWSPTAVMVKGFKFSYHNQAGDYSSQQTRNVGRWEQFPVTLHLTYPEDMSDGNKQAVKNAISAWQKYVDITLVDEPEKARIELNWVTELTEEDELGETDLSATHVDAMGRTIIDKAVIRMLDPASFVNTYPDALKSAVMHQLGHALGINSHSDNAKDLMAEPTYKRVKNPIVKKTIRSLASKTLGQFIDIPNTDDGSERKRVIVMPVTKISKRDLNTLFRMYN